MKKFKSNFMYYTFTAIFFIIYFKLIGYVCNRWMPLNPTVNLFTLWVLFFIAIPASAISADKLLEKIEV